MNEASHKRESNGTQAYLEVRQVGVIIKGDWLVRKSSLNQKNNESMEARRAIL